MVAQARLIFQNHYIGQKNKCSPNVFKFGNMIKCKILRHPVKKAPQKVKRFKSYSNKTAVIRSN